MKPLRIRWIVLIGILCCVVLSVSAQASAPRFNMSYLYFGSPSSYLNAVDASRGSLTELSPSYFDLNADGSLKLNASLSTEFIQQMHQQKRTVVPFLSNHWNQEMGIAALDNRDELTDQIAEAVEKYQLDGIHVDLENLTHLHKQSYYEFVKLLRDKIPKEKTVAVAVAANPYGYTTGWQGSYDYEKLGKVADYLMIMAYDEHYEGGSPGAVTSLPFAKKSIDYALRYVPAEKVVLGIPFYGRIWSDQGSLMTGQGVPGTQIAKLIESYDGVVTFDSTSRSAVAHITLDANDKKPSIGGKTLTAGSYSIWFENEQAMKELLLLVEQYNLKGTGSWSLGQEMNQTWDYYSLWLNGLPFADAQGHWAMQEIVSIARAGIMTGMTSHSFAPDRSLTRAEAAVTLVRMLNLPTAPANTPDFVDTASHWARNEIRTAQYHGLVTGFDSQRFAPDAPMTRQEMAVLLDRAFSSLSSSPTMQNSFPDVTMQQNAWSYDAILRLSTAGILQGFPDGSFRPQDQVTRAQMVSMIQKLPS